MMFRMRYCSPLLLALMIVACSVFTGPDEVNNPFDPQNPDYVRPYAIIDQPLWGEVHHPGWVLVAWHGSTEPVFKESAMEFSYQLDNRPWSTWTTDTQVMYNDLDDGSHMFRIHSRYPTGIATDTPDSVMFYVQTPQI